MEYSNRGLSWKFIVVIVLILAAVVYLPVLVFDHILGSTPSNMLIFLLIDGTLAIFFSLVVIGIVYVVLTIRKRNRDVNFAKQPFFTVKRIVLVSIFGIVFLWTAVASVIAISNTIKDVNEGGYEANIFISENNAAYGDNYTNQLKFRYEWADEEISSMEGFDTTTMYNRKVYHLSNMEIKAGNVYKMLYFKNTGTMMITELVRAGA